MHSQIEEDASGIVLIVDDDFTVRLLAREALEQAGFTVLENDDGVGLLAQFAEEEPDIVLLDVMLPGLDGFTLCRQIRELPSGKNTPILMMTGLDDVASIRQAYTAGATDFIAKPFNWLILAYRVRYMMRTSQLFQNLDKSQASLNYAQQIAGLGSWEWDISSDKLQWSDAVYRIFHIDPIGFDGTYHAFLNSVHPLDKELVNAALETAISQKKPYSVDHQILLPNGDERHVHTEAEVMYDKTGTPFRLSGTVQDITERKLDEERIKRLAFYDSLTGLPNRVLFKENLEHALAHAERKKRLVATLFLDLDRFKWINDTMGHSVGDKLLQEFAARLHGSVRKIDCVTRGVLSDPCYSIARLGGDEFTIILDDIGQVQDAAIVARRIITEVARPFILEGQETYLTVSIGISIYPDDGCDIVTLIKHADTAMYHAKDQGKNNFQYYTSAMTENACELLRLENQLHRALERDEFTLCYQPQVDMESGRVECLEALLRWNNPDLGQVPPCTFIPLAEETGLILAIDAWVMTQACRQLKEWEALGLSEVRVAVNVSGQNFLQKSLPETTRGILAATGIRPGCLELELTEGVLMRNGAETIAILGELKAMGLTLAIDDFGTGYSSLSYLKRFRLDTLKIDRSFINDLTSDQDSVAIVTALIALASSMKMSVVAEGVETLEQLELLRELGCRRIQGYLYSRPLTREDATRLLRDEGGVLAPTNSSSDRGNQ
jgi:diguanylate cyclase (GGDEF)-like protein/PAS domain S-box-containing protein